ncbi:hypothetical protein [Budvicia aquatica]|uniref:Uncharacterized protein n=1 Tax=Budvicia aquatica TaxID=82979 RepID=A0A2C6DN29_9GAMM|nr:hypothetical protein [Budvicia aquatica]PHI31748.1 hypothetical protein CRN84_21655 [Budvicia aquatica]VFS52623.1 Uncharacterised protein [Budvicia aquatica]
MSQFILIPIKLKYEDNLNHLDFLSPVDSKFLEDISHCLDLYSKNFHLYTVNDFDSICMDAQQSLAEGKSIEDTNLFFILNVILKITTEFFVWYGNEYHELDIVTTMDKAIENIVESLKNSSGEIYLHYKCS